jgi:hypothetical protein
MEKVYRAPLETRGRQDRNGFGRSLKPENAAIPNVWRGFWAKNAAKGVARLTRMSFQRCPSISGQLLLKTAILQGFSLENCKNL